MITTGEAAELLGVSVRRVNALIESGSLSAQKFGRSWMVDERSVRERAATSPRSGRPLKGSGEGRQPLRFTLMSCEHEVLSFDYLPRTGEISRLQPLDGIDWKPFGVGRIDRNPDRYDMAEWIRARAIPAARPNLPAALRELAVGTPSLLMFDSLGLSLTDPYWFKPEGVGVAWADVNFFDHGYREELGGLMLDGPAFAAGRSGNGDGGVQAVELPLLADLHAVTLSPDTATNGMLGKAWTRRGGIDYLIKGGSGGQNREPYNEKLATRLLERILLPGEFVRYEVVSRRGRAYSACPSMVGRGFELIPAHDVLTAFGVSGGRDLRRGYLAALERLGVADAQRLVDKMIVADYLMANFDRHTHNFGLIRDAEALDGYRVAPLFDHGCGFYSRAGAAELENGRYLWESHPFSTYPSQQLAMVEDITWYDPEALSGFADDIAEVLGENPDLDEWFIEGVQRQTARQIEAVADMAAERSLIIPGW